MTHRKTTPLDADDNLTLATLLKAVTDDIEVGQTSDLHPSDGRLLEDSADGTIYVGNGSSWVDATAAIGLDSPSYVTNSLIGADVANATADTVPTAQGDGTLAMAEAGGSDVTTVAPLEAATGEEADATGTNAFAAGASNASAGGPDSIAIGNSTSATGDSDIAIGESARTEDGGQRISGVAIGSLTVAEQGSVAIGSGATSNESDSVAIGQSASTTTETGGVAIGFSADVTSGQGVAIGENSAANLRSTALGNNADASANARCVLVGSNTTTTVNNGIAIGDGASIDTADGARIECNQMVWGGVQGHIADADLNNEELTVEADETNSQMIIRYKDSAGTVQTSTVAWDA